MSHPDPAPGDDRSDVTSRFIAAPRPRVFDAIADPLQLMRWWGPAGFRSSFDVFEPRPGGQWRFTMHSADGQDFPNIASFSTWETGRRVVVRHENVHLFDLTLRLEDEAGGTRLHWRQQFDSIDEYRRIARFVRSANEENLDRLQALLADDPAGYRGTGPDGRRLVEVRSYRLKPGTLDAFDRVVREQAVPMLRDWQTDVVAHGATAGEADGYTLVRSYRDLADRQARQDAFYGSLGWREGPRAAVVGAIEAYLSSTLWLSPGAIDELRWLPGVDPAGGLAGSATAF
jgi:uncharacterized protein YndB with AHSA1/START domain